MYRTKKNFYCFGITLSLLIACSHVNASMIRLTPPTSLNIDGVNIVEGVFTVKSLTGIELDLSRTEVLSLTNIADDIVHHAIIGSGVGSDLGDPGSFPILQFTYGFDATLPDLPEIISNVISVSKLFTISLPLVSSTSDFYEIIDINGNASFHTEEAVLDNTASGFTNIDLFNDGSVYATFGMSNVALPNVNFQDHGTIRVPESSTLAIFALGLMGLASRRFKKEA